LIFFSGIGKLKFRERPDMGKWRKSELIGSRRVEIPKHPLWAVALESAMFKRKYPELDALKLSDCLTEPGVPPPVLYEYRHVFSGPFSPQLIKE
jgi:hypothetical protein